MNQYLWLGRRWRREKSNIIHLQSVALAFTSRVSNKRYQQEFAKRGGWGGGERLGQINIQRAHRHRIRELKQRRRRRQWERQKRVKGLDRQNNNSARASRIFLCRHCATTTWKYLISHFVDNVNTRQQLSLSFPELQYSLLEFNSRKNCQNLTNWNRYNKRDKVWSSATSLFKWRFRSRRLVVACLISSLLTDERMDEDPISFWKVGNS